jgi:hypothetical protein
MSNRRIVSSLSMRAAALALCLGTGLASVGFAQEAAPTEPPPSAPPSDEPTFDPPPPPENPTPPEVAANESSEPEPAPPVETQEAPSPDGQWVYTNQYGWVFMPYAQSYTYVPATGYPFAFAYGPHWGWRWLSAPWVIGVGPAPYWGPRGAVMFAWRAHPWFPRRAVVHVAPAHHFVGGGRGFAHAHFHRR